MKKYIAVALALVFAFAFVSCTAEQGETGSTASTVSVDSVAPVSVAEISDIVSVPVISVIDIPSIDITIPDTPDNLAIGAEVTDCGKPVYEGAHVAANINDGNTDTPGWQITNADFEAGDFVEITFEEVHSIDQIVIFCEDSTTPAFGEGYSIEITADGETYEKLEGAAVESDTGDTHRADTITFGEAAEVKGVKVVLESKKSGKDYAPHLYEIEIYEAEETEEEAPAESAEDTTASEEE